MEQTYLIVATGDAPNDTGILFISAGSQQEAFDKWIFEYQDFEKDDISIINSMLEDNPVGIATIESTEDFTNPNIEWQYSYNYPE